MTNPYFSFKLVLDVNGLRKIFPLKSLGEIQLD